MREIERNAEGMGDRESQRSRKESATETWSGNELELGETVPREDV